MRNSPFHSATRRGEIGRTPPRPFLPVRRVGHPRLRGYPQEEGERVRGGGSAPAPEGEDRDSAPIVQERLTKSNLNDDDGNLLLNPKSSVSNAMRQSTWDEK